MFSFKSIVLVVAAFIMSAECSVVPAVAAAPLIAPAHVGYAHAVPQNIPPYASQVSVVNRAFSPYVAAPLAASVAPVAAPFAAAPYLARAVAPVPAPFAPAPYLAGPASYGLPAAYAAAPAAYAGAPAAYAGAPAAYAAPFPYSAPYLRSPYGYAPAYVR